MATRLFALISGLFYLIFGIAGFIPGMGWRPEMPRLRMDTVHFHATRLGGVLDVNWPHNILWILIGIGGIAAFASYVWSRAYARGLFVATTLFTLIGLMPLGINRLWGYLPFSGFNVLIYAVTAMLAWYYGFVYPSGRARNIAQ